MLKQAKNIFFLGLKGVAMANLAVILKKMGKTVYGADVEEEFITDKLLKENKISWQNGFTKLPQDTDLIVYSAAHKGIKNSLIVEAKKKGISLISQAELLGELMSQFQIKIAIAGCHGKTTSASLLSYSLNKLNAKPTYLVGAPFFTDYQGADFQDKKYFIAEADEYGINPPTDKTPKFFKLNPDWIVCTNIDFDHPDVYKNIEETKKAFIKFFNNKRLIINIDDDNLLECIDKSKYKEVQTYGFSNKANYQIIDYKINDKGSEFNIKSNNDTRQAKMTFFISLFGKHNVSNATAVIVQLLQLGFKPKEIRDTIKGFMGAKRRFEIIYHKGRNFIFDDYAHHPQEIKATVEAARIRFAGRKLIGIFQPHTFSRTLYLLEEFRESLSGFDIGFVLPIFASARENSSQLKVSSKDIVKGIKKLLYTGSVDELIKKLDKELEDGDIIFTMGAGDVYKLKEKIIKIIDQKLQIKNQKFNLNLKIEKNKDISHYLTLRNHVKAEYFLEAKTRKDLISAKKYSLENKLPLFILGGGSNLAITKTILSGLIVKNNYIDLTIFKEDKNNVIISVSSGYPVSLLIAKSIQFGWSGFEYHQGLPGTVGGAIYMNSKWTKPITYFGDNLIYAYLLDQKGRIKKVNKSYFNFAYDYSILQKTKEIILEGFFKVRKLPPKIIKKRAKFALDYRKKTQPYGVASSGCFFRNPGKISAGYLIDKAGLKGISVGDYFVSQLHANFIINKGNGKREDLIKLLNIIKTRVKNKFNIELKEEVIVI